MEFFVELPDTMTKEHYDKFNIGLINCLNHVLRSGSIWAEDRESFIDKLKETNIVEYNFVTQAVAAMLKAPLDNEQVKENLVYLDKMLVGSKQAATDASSLTTSLYYGKLILNWPDVIKRLSNPKVNIRDDEKLMKEFHEKITLAEKLSKAKTQGKDQL